MIYSKICIGVLFHKNVGMRYNSLFAVLWNSNPMNSSVWDGISLGWYTCWDASQVIYGTPSLQANLKNIIIWGTVMQHPYFSYLNIFEEEKLACMPIFKR